MASGAGASAIQLDQEHRIVRVGQGVDRGAGLRVTVDLNRLDDCGEWNAGSAGISPNADGLHARARDVEVDGVVSPESPWVLQRDARIAQIISGINRGHRLAK